MLRSQNFIKIILIKVRLRRYRRKITLMNILVIMAVIWIAAVVLVFKVSEKNIWKDICRKFIYNAFPDNFAAGEMGKPVILPDNISDQLNKTITELWHKNYFNQYASDMISVNRTCQMYAEIVPGRYLTDLLVTDVIICFHNEAWSTLIRTVHSVLNRSPKHLIGQVILVDDFSNMTHLKQPLDDYFFGNSKIKIVRATKREGLIRARLLGYNYSTSPVLTFLDSHCECTEGWLEPLLDRIARNSKTVVTPFVDIIDDWTFEFLTRNENETYLIGGFNWRFEYTWIQISDREMKRHNNFAEPMHTPTTVGGIFAIDRKFFEELGLYDTGYEYWGAENLELSFKTWMCGGILEAVFCSHVGHVFRKENPIRYDAKPDAVLYNTARLVNVWLDDYAKIFYKYYGSHSNITAGDVSDRLELRKRLGCQNFQWYLDNIYPEQFIPISYGAIKHIESNRCLDAPDSETELKEIGLIECHGEGENQFWMITKLNEIRKNMVCLVNESGNAVLKFCNNSTENKYWKFNLITQQIENQFTNQCLSISPNREQTILEKCNLRRWRQRWRLE